MLIVCFIPVRTVDLKLFAIYFTKVNLKLKVHLCEYFKIEIRYHFFLTKVRLPCQSKHHCAQYISLY